MGSIFKSLSITTLVTLTVSALMWSIGYPFYTVFVFTFIGQLMFFYMFNTVLRYVIMLKNKKLENNRIKEFTLQGVELHCAHCNSSNLTPLRFDQDNIFSCLNCEKGNSVYINITVAQSSSPLDINSLTTQAIIKEKESALDSLST
jgi:transcription elongation factor Elf1